MNETEHLDEQTRARMVEHAVPAGFEPMKKRLGFVLLCDSVYVDYERLVLGARILPKHLNPLGIAHGGMLATLADTAFGTIIRLTSAAELPPATISLNMDYISPAHEGSWIAAHVEIHKLGRRLANASCMLMDGDRLVARATATFMQSTRSLHGKA